MNSSNRKKQEIPTNYLLTKKLILKFTSSAQKLFIFKIRLKSLGLTTEVGQSWDIKISISFSI